jgi:hypothetical protein
MKYNSTQSYVLALNVIFSPVRYLADLIRYTFQVKNIQVNFKSGRSEKFFFLKCSWKSNNTGITSFEWEVMGNKRPGYFNLDEIESIIKLY